MESLLKLVGHTVSCRGRSRKEYGVVVIEEGVICIRFDNKKEDDCEELLGLPFEEEPDYILKHIDSNGRPL